MIKFTSIRCQTYLIARDQICVLLVWLKLIVQMVLLSECVSRPVMGTEQINYFHLHLEHQIYSTSCMALRKHWIHCQFFCDGLRRNAQDLIHYMDNTVSGADVLNQYHRIQIIRSYWATRKHYISF